MVYILIICVFFNKNISQKIYVGSNKTFMVNFNINNINSNNKILLLRNYHDIALPKTGLYSLTKKFSNQNDRL